MIQRIYFKKVNVVVRRVLLFFPIYEDRFEVIRAQNYNPERQLFTVEELDELLDMGVQYEIKNNNRQK